MSVLPEQVYAYVGLQTGLIFASEPVERGAVRRYAQAIMDDDPVYHDAAASEVYGGPVAPPLFPTHMFRRDFGLPDLLRERAADPDFDGSGATLQGLPEIAPLADWATLNGGAELEFYRYARQGEQVLVRSSYESITEKQTSRGPIALVVVLNEYLTGGDTLLVRQRRTYIRRPPA